MNIKHVATIAAVAIGTFCGVNTTLADGFPESQGFVYVDDVDVATMLGITDTASLEYLVLEAARVSSEVELPSLVATDSTAFDAIIVAGGDIVLCTESVTFDKGLGRYRPGAKTVPWCNYDPFTVAIDTN